MVRAFFMDDQDLFGANRMQSWNCRHFAGSIGGIQVGKSCFDLAQYSHGLSDVDVDVISAGDDVAKK